MEKDKDTKMKEKKFYGKKNCSSNKNGKGAKSDPKDKDPGQQDKGKDRKTWNNDPSWYEVSPELTRAAASLPFSYFPGSKLPKTPHTGGQYGYNSVPGVMEIRYVPAIGRSEDLLSAPNVAARAIYSWVRHQNSGSKNYEAVDLMLYILAMESIYIQINEAKRIYGVAMRYDVANRNIPDLILDTLGVDADDVRRNLAQFRYGINLAVAKISALCVPQAFDIFKRHAIISTTILADSDSSRAQFYAWVASGYYVFQPKTTSTGGMLEFKYRGTERRTVKVVLDQINEALDALLTDEDINVMSGDILKAYGRENLYSVPELAENYTADLFYDEGMLQQIENAVCLQCENLDVTQKDGAILFKPHYVSSNQQYDSAISLLGTYTVLNSHKNNPSPEDIVEFSRGQSAVILNKTTNKWEIYCASELIQDFRVHYFIYQDNGTIDKGALSFESLVILDTLAPDTIPAIMQQWAYWSNFDWAPILYAFYHNSSTSQSEVHFTGFIGDLKEYTYVNPEDLRRLNDVCIMGLFKTQLMR